MKRGDVARGIIRDRIIEAFRPEFVKLADKKIYINVKDGPGGEVCQFAINLTMPKVMIEADYNREERNPNTGAPPWEDQPSSIDLTEKERKDIDRLKEMLGL
ncbi:MAG: hypothetical protein NC548_22755 [Lachnospiraceae bacterium]|nr:hypothetical protein [Lachnospiraceae bacterium]